LSAADDRVHACAYLQKAVEWIAQVARDHVPAAFRSSFLENNPVNRAVLAAARTERLTART
jgi:hypothetical protein